MKELKLEVGKAGNLKNFYEHPLKIGRNEEGYFIYTKDKKHGPFTNVFLEKGSNDVSAFDIMIEKEPVTVAFAKVSKIDFCKWKIQINPG